MSIIAVDLAVESVQYPPLISMRLGIQQNDIYK